jgi:hypothetical protein
VVLAGAAQDKELLDQLLTLEVVAVLEVMVAVAVAVVAVLQVLQFK